MAEKKLKADLQVLKGLYGHIPAEIEFIQTTTHTLDSKSECESLRTIQTRKPLSLVQYPQFVKLESIAQEITEKEPGLENECFEILKFLAPRYQIGDQFEEVVDIEELETVGYTFKPATWKPKRGMITMINIWRIVYQSEDAMEQNKLMLQRNEHWKGKVEIVGFALHEEPSYLSEKIKRQEWNSIHHFRFTIESGYQNFTIRALKSDISSPPVVAFLNQDGKIVYIGKHSKGHAEELINKLINGEQQIQEIVQNEIQQQMDKQIIGQADFKKLKSKLRGEIQEYLKSLNLECQEPQFVRMKLVKTNQVTSTGKIPLERSKLMINYSVKIQDKTKIDQLIQFLHTELTPANIIIESAEIIDSKCQQSRDEVKQFIKQQCESYGFQIQFLHSRSVKYSFSPNDQLLISEEEQRYKGILNKTPAEKIFPVINIIQKINLHTSSDAWAVRWDMEEAGRAEIGEIFQPIDGYKKIKTPSDQIIHKQGQILVLHYCAVYRDNCISSMQADNQLLKSKKAEWGDQVKMIGLNVSQQWYCLDFIESVKNLEEIEQYFPINDEDRPETLRYHAEEWPYYVIVDKEGKIAHLGSIDKLEQFIENLITPKQILQEQQQILQQQVVTLEQLESLKQLLSQSKDAFKGMGNQQSFNFKLDLSALYISEVADAEFIKVERPTLSYWVRSNKVEQLNKLLSQIYKIVPKECFKVDEKISQLIDVPFPGKECIVCKVALSDQISQYYSPFKNEFVCVACAEFEDMTQIGLARFKYIDTLIFIKAPLTDLSILKEIDEYKLGRNIQQFTDEEYKQNFAIGCNGCNTIYEGLRYISIKTTPGQCNFWNLSLDFCYKCFVILQDKTSERAQAIMKDCDLVGRSMNGLFLRVLYRKGHNDF